MAKPAEQIGLIALMLLALAPAGFARVHSSTHSVVKPGSGGKDKSDVSADRTRKSRAHIQLSLAPMVGTAYGAQPDANRGSIPVLDLQNAAAPIPVCPISLTQPAGSGEVELLSASSSPYQNIVSQVIAEPAPRVFVVPNVVPENGRAKSRFGLGGLLGKLFGPIVGPIHTGLAGTASELAATSYGLYRTDQALEQLRQPLLQMAQPLGGLNQPLTGLQKPLANLSAPITGLQGPVTELSKSAGSLGSPISGLGKDITGLRQSLKGLEQPLGGMQRPLEGISQPLEGMQQPLRDLPKPLHELVNPLLGLQEPLRGLQAPLNGLAAPLNNLQLEVHDLRTQIDVLHQAILDIGRNVTLAIVFGSCVIAYAIWTHRKVPSVSEPTVTTTEEDVEHGTTITKTAPVSQVAAAKPSAAPSEPSHADFRSLESVRSGGVAPDSGPISSESGPTPPPGEGPSGGDGGTPMPPPSTLNPPSD